MLKSIEQRVTDVEDLIADIPQMIGLRLDSTTASIHETNARIAILDKMASSLIRDVRDMRGAVTRQLIAQDAEIAAMKAMLEEVLTRLPKA